ncbi:alpha/beta hydrolase [Rhodoligotrophos defluvii]|uniref:alpha/beta hydrolase n=1 Tax=Rhodoligotrophos defluvii TaxID=2561934 RepID=UPI0010C9946B|nr:prolyl oligopeptidase family serine peptidase [Rhodoligotrophos defluvii]
MIDGPRLLPLAGGRPEHLIVMLHGYAADGRQMLNFARQWQNGLPHAVFVCPNAPEPCEQSDFGRQWFPLTPPKAQQYWPGVERAGPLLDAFITDALARYDLLDASLALVGFSQGTMMALHVGLRRNPPRGGPPAGILGYCGAMAGPEFLGEQITSRPPVMLIHGDLDEVVPVQAMTIAAAALTRVGVEVETHLSRGIGHEITADGLALGLQFLQERLAAAP